MQSKSQVIKLMSLAAIMLMTVNGLAATTTFEQAVQKYEAGDLAAARAGLNALLLDDDRNGGALYYLGRLSLDEAKLDEAIELLARATAVDPAQSNYHSALGRAYIQKLQGAEMFEKGMLAGRALESLNKAVGLNPENIEARMSLAGYYLNAPPVAGGSKKKARAQVEEIVKIDPMAGNALLAGLYAAEENHEQAIEAFKKCIEMDPANKEYRYSLAMIYQTQKEFEQAFDVFEQMLEINPEERGALYQYARTAVFAHSNVDRGIVCLDTYLTLEVENGMPMYESAHWRLGMLYEHKGEIDEARRCYRTAMKLNPENPEYDKSLKNLASN